MCTNVGATTTSAEERKHLKESTWKESQGGCSETHWRYGLRKTSQLKQSLTRLLQGADPPAKMKAFKSALTNIAAYAACIQGFDKLFCALDSAILHMKLLVSTYSRYKLSSYFHNVVT